MISFTLRVAILAVSIFTVSTGAEAASAYQVLPPYQKSGQFDFNITVHTIPWVTYGVKTPFFITTSKKMNASCSVYRWEGDSAWTHTYVGALNLKNGYGKSSVTWEWDSSSTNPKMNLQVFCKSGKLYGAGFKLVTGQWGHD
jgi:hypothetical protein